MELEEIKLLIKELEKSSLKKIVIKKDKFELQLEKDDSPSLQTKVVSMQPQTQEVLAEPKDSTKSSGKEIKSPIVGTFYSAPAPDQPPFVKVGDTVEEDTVVCVIEAMKVMNEVKAGQKGKITEILAENTQPVEFGATLFRLD